MPSEERNQQKIFYVNFLLKDIFDDSESIKACATSAFGRFNKQLVYVYRETLTKFVKAEVDKLFKRNEFNEDAFDLYIGVKNLTNVNILQQLTHFLSHWFTQVCFLNLKYIFSY